MRPQPPGFGEGCCGAPGQWIGAGASDAGALSEAVDSEVQTLQTLLEYS